MMAIRAAHTTAQSSTLPSSKSGVAKKPRAAKASKHSTSLSYSLTLTDEQWAELRVCVLCEEKWSTRKSAKGKATHVKSCTSKHLTTDERVLTLIREHLDSVTQSPPVPSSSKTPPTLLDDVVVVAEPPMRRRPKNHAEAESRPTIEVASGDWGNGASDPFAIPMSAVLDSETLLDASAEPRNISVDQQYAFSGVPSRSGASNLSRATNSAFAFFESDTDVRPYHQATQQLPPSRFATKSLLMSAAAMTSMPSLIATTLEQDPLPSGNQNPVCTTSLH